MHSLDVNNNYPGKLRLLLFFQLLSVLGFLLATPVICSAKVEVRLGVLAYRGYGEALKMWSPTAEYLTGKIPPIQFSVVPLDFHEIGPAVQEGKVDFVLANTSIYVELEALYGVTRISTLKNLRKGKAYTLFGGVIFCRNDRDDLKTLKDLKGKALMAVEETSLGGWRMAWLEFKKAGINPYKDFRGLQFGDTHDAVVYAVRDGKVDAGTVRTDTIERMASEGLIDPKIFRIINQQYAQNFPFALSTALYPEWPFAKVKHTSDDLSQKVAVALMSMPSDSPAAKSAKIAGWTTPLNYQPVHELMKELRVGPYKYPGKISLADLLRKYWYLLILTIAGLSSMGAVTIYVIRLNRKIRQANLAVEKTNTELRTKNIEIGEAQMRLQRLIESSPDMIIAVDADRKIVEFNISAQQIFGYPIEEVLGRHVDMLYSRSEEGVIIHKALKETGRFIGETVNKRKNGDVFTSFITASVLLDSNGNHVGSMGISRDITERKQVEAQLLKLYQALEQSPSSVIITDINGYIEYVNLKFVETTGYTREEALGKRPNLLKSDKTPPEIYRDLWNTIKSGREWYGEFINKKKNGAIFWENASISPVKNSEGVVTHFVAFKEDITERKMLEERFRQIMSENQIILENANIGIALLKERKIMHINKKFEALFGYQRDEISGGTTEILYKDSENYRQMGEEKYKVLASGNGFSSELMMKRKDNSLFWCKLFGKAIDPDDLSRGSIWLFEDISERKESELKLRQQQHQLQELNRNLEKIVAEEVAKNLEKDHIMIRQAHLADLGVLAAGITHEINTPLTYIKGNLELLRMETGATEGQGGESSELFDEIDDGIIRISGIIESMKELSGFSKKERSTTNLFRTLVYSNRIVHNRAKHITNIYINGQLFDMKVDRDAGVFMAEIAAQRLEQVWVIILNNALDELLKSDLPFEKRYIKIEISRSYDRIQVTIRDNAGGIPEGLIAKIFDLFVSTKAQSGTGIGLNVAKTIIEDHDGTIRAFNDGCGAVFEVLL